MTNANQCSIRRLVCGFLLVAFVYSPKKNTAAGLPDILEEKIVSLSNQQQLTITGKVNEMAGSEGVPGVSVLVKGSQKGTTTDIDGKFRLENVPANATLVFTMVGYKTQEQPVNNRSTITITLQDDVANLEEVVVVGYGTQKKETVTGSVASVKSDQLVKSPSLNVSNSLAGRLPGVIATQNSGEPGGDGSNIKIRGTNTLGNSSPLVVIDGIPARQGGIERLNPADIDNISVLKDAAAAIYGARAANGVILVTTKRGKSGRPLLSYTYNQGFSQPTVIPELADAAQYAEMRNELELFKLPVAEWGNASTALKQEGQYTRPSGSVLTAPFQPAEFQQFRDGSDPWGHPNTDWYGSTLKTWSPQARHNVQLTGGSEDFTYLTSIGYQNQDGYYKNSATGYKQYDIRINMDAKISKYVTAKIGILGRQENRSFPTKSAGTIFRMLMRGNPTQPAFWPNGMPGPDIENGENPVVITTDQTGYDNNKQYYFQTNGQLDITIPGVEGLKFTGTASVDKFMKQSKKWETPWFLYTWQGAYEQDGVTPQLVRGKRGPADPRLTQASEDQLNVLLGGVLNYDKKFGDHTFNVMAGVNRETIDNENFNAYRRYFISTAIDQLVAGGEREKNNNGGAWNRARLNYFGRVGYNYKEKYIAEFLWRYDGSYMFPENSRFGFFPGVLAGWRISEENFWKENVPFVNYLKLRGSWGRMGNDNIYFKNNYAEGQYLEDDAKLQEYQYYSTYGYGTYIVDGLLVKSLYESRVPNAFVTWEVADNYNLGLDGQLMDGKINFELDVFMNKRSNILWQRNASIPQSTGMTLPAENIGKVDNKGWEFNVGYNGTAGDLKYNVSVNGGYTKNKIKFWDEAPGAPEWQRTTGRVSDAQLYYIYDGVFRDEADIAANTLDYSAITNNIRPGDMKYQDYDGDGKITPDDRIRRDKNRQPTFQGGLNIGLQYKNFDLTVLFQGASGGELRVASDESGAIGNYLLEFYENRWTVENPSSEHPRITDRSDQYYSNNNTYWLQSTNYIRLKNVELGYTLPTKIGEKIGISNLRVYVSGFNLLTFSKMKAYDPESTNVLGQYYPQSRILNTGLAVTF
ncbi:SusC/RagA family TonB-linked outer membrane protein [Olivibacter domesticus]|uniref:TonB-linked outer membrane protein, SusC/RagA family n=1 Tax=Olivibacter domesticus TaxID=407022 RepID=A0A1H7VFC6_OLID1|nr:TonB-dependent receptor [Olivibacter domesticus]SEM07966.1 TonB-linked outer membrane protein, SusC/RagA family [Olivibacter domesticus]